MCLRHGSTNHSEDCDAIAITMMLLLMMMMM